MADAPPIVARFVRTGTVTMAQELALPFFRDLESGLRVAGIEDDELDDAGLRQSFGADLDALGWAPPEGPTASSLSDAMVVAVFFVSDASGQWLVGKIADRIVSTVRPAVRRLMARLRGENGAPGWRKSVRLTTDVWIAEGSRRVTITAVMNAVDDRSIDELVAAALERALTTVGEGEHVVDDVPRAGPSRLGP